jgi:sugar lactone lactonase YvrE
MKISIFNGVQSIQFKPFQKKQWLLNSGLSIILTSILLLGLSKVSSAQWSAYYPDNNPLFLPITALDTEKPQWDIFTANEEHLYAVNYKTGQLVIFSGSENLAHLVNLPLPAGTLTKSGSIWLSEDRIYLKGSEGNRIWIFSSQGILLKKLHLQCDPERYYNFTDLAVDPRGYIYLLDAQSLEVESFDCNGKYNGTFAKKGVRFNNLPARPECFCLDKEGNFYFGVHDDDTGESRIVKFSYQGLLSTAFTSTVTSYHYRSLWVDSFQNLYATVPENSLVLKFDSRGQQICQFDAENSGSLVVNSQGMIFVASSKGNLITRFRPSQVVTLIDDGNRALHDDNPDQAEIYFKRAFTLNNQFEYIHSILGEVYFRQHHFIKSMAEFQYLRDYWRYSQSLVYLRNELLTNYGFLFAISLMGFIFFAFLMSCFFHLPSRSFLPIKILLQPRSALENSKPLISPAMTWVIVLMVIISFYCSWYYANPIFIVERQVFSLKILCRDLAVILILTLIGTGVAYKVGELFQGMATYPDILAGTAISLFPLIIGFPLLAFISHILTYNESWIYQWLNYLLIFWVMTLYWMTLKISEDFSWNKALGVGFLDLSVSGLVLLFIIFLLGVNQQLIGFCYDLIYEIYTRLVS